MANEKKRCKGGNVIRDENYKSFFHIEQVILRMMSMYISECRHFYFQNTMKYILAAHLHGFERHARNSHKKTTYPALWNKFQRAWARPAAINAHMKKGTNFLDFNT